MDAKNGVLFVPTGGYGSFKNEVDIVLNRVELGTSAIGTTSATTGSVTYAFSAKTTPYNFVLSSNGTSGVFSLGDIAGCGVTLTPPTTGSDGKLIYALDKNGAQQRKATDYAAGGTCSLPITFTPTSVGDVSATLSMLDADQNVLNAVVLHGTGQDRRSL